MRLYLMRHGIAIDREDPDCPEEAQRYLTTKGVDRTRAAGRGLAELGIKPDGLLTSPYLRAVQTGELICEALDIDTQSLVATEALKPDAKAGRLIDELEKLGKEEVMCFGHAPHMDDFIAFAVGARRNITALKKGGVACLEFVMLAPPNAELLWLLTPKMLRKLGD